MKRLLAMLLCLLMLGGCSVLPDPLHEAAAPLTREHSPLPGAAAQPALRTRSAATLYFRYLDEPLLAPEYREIDFSPDQPQAMTLLRALLDGPDVHSASLNALFPAEVEVLSTVQQGRTLFVTLSGEIMNPYPDEPADWARDPYWAQEVPLRRELCMQSLVATLTENCDVDSVQVLLEPSGAVTSSLRLRLRYFSPSDSSDALAPPLTRNESLLLTPDTALHTILTLWQQRDWLRLARYVPDADALALDALALPHLIDFSFSGGSLSADSGSATYTLCAHLADQQRSGRIIRLQQERGLWRISLNQLTGWLED